MSSKRIRVSKKFYGELPADVAQVVKDKVDHFGSGMLKMVTVCSEPAGYAHYCGEGERITVVYGGQAMGIEMVDSSTLGASGLRHEIGHRQPMPAGAWIVSVYYGYGYGKYLMRIINVGLPALAA